jgi:hypothetical protein
MAISDSGLVVERRRAVIRGVRQPDEIFRIFELFNSLWVPLVMGR